MVLWRDRGEDTLQIRLKKTHLFKFFFRLGGENYLYREIYNVRLLALFI